MAIYDESGRPKGYLRLLAPVGRVIYRLLLLWYLSMAIGLGAQYVDLYRVFVSTVVHSTKKSQVPEESSPPPTLQLQPPEAAMWQERVTYLGPF